MKLLFKTLLALFLLVVISCKKESSETSTSDTRDILEGSWICNETSQIFGERPPYTIVISKDTNNINQVLVENLYQINPLAGNIFMQINGSNLVIPQQILANFTIDGSGVLSNNVTMNLTYTVDDIAAGTDAVTALYTKTN